ncbi:MAG: thioesterase family protein [Chloroflexi bacterium]|nr:thioesterase family protein [Chloroflexota bacterium]
MGDAIFRRDGDTYIATEFGMNPWYRDVVHGGAATGLLTHHIERHVGGPEYQLVRITVDLFHAVPGVPLTVTTETVRGGRRVMGVHGTIWANGDPVTRAYAQLLRRSDVLGLQPPAKVPPGPEGLVAHRGFQRPNAEGTIERPANSLEGFHTTVEVAWATDDDAPHPAAWMRVPMPFIDGEESSLTTSIAALADFGNAVGGRFRVDGQTGGSFINSDVTLYLDRNPVDEWVCVEVPYRQEIDGVGHTESICYDRAGRFGRIIETRLANPRYSDRAQGEAGAGGAANEAS